ncbi:MAG: cell division protein FtsX [Hyphomicrobiaceae bacterium]
MRAMSGPNDDAQTGRPLPTLSHNPQRQLSRGDPATGQSTSRQGDATGEGEPFATDLYLPPPAIEPGAEQANAPIVQAGSVTGKSLTLVIAIMCFLACLTAGAVYLINQSANAWLRDISTEVTVQIEPAESTEETARVVKRVVDLLVAQAGVLDVRVLSEKESAGLLEPWLGNNPELTSLPIPRLVAIELDRNVEPDFAAFKRLLAKEYPKATLDDHRQWQNQIRTVTRSFALGGLAILLLVGAATTAIIVSATRSAMASNREIVEVLHFVGATDRFIAREFEKHFLTLGIRAGIVGAGSAMAVFFLMPTVMQFLGGGSVTLAEFKRLVGTGGLDAPGYLLLALVVIVIAALCMLTSRFGVFRILHSQS